MLSEARKPPKIDEYDVITLLCRKTFLDLNPQTCVKVIVLWLQLVLGYW